MTPQSNIMVLVPITESSERELRQMLAGMNLEPGVADPGNSLVPFGKIETLHFARFVILEDTTREDLRAYGEHPASATKSLALLCDFDGPSEVFLRELVACAEPGLRRIFSCCQPVPSADLLAWLKAHETRSSAAYVNWIGRTVLGVREENALYAALVTYLNQTPRSESTPRQIWNELRAFVHQEQVVGRLRLTPPAPTPLAWRVKNLLHSIGIPLLLLLLSPLILLYLPIFLIQLRIHETTDPVIAPRPTVDHAHELATLEDRNVTNQFSAYGNIKPGLFRRWTIAAVFYAIDYAAQHIYNRGFLARVVTIHFARWVSLDNHTRALFASNYDGNLESYMSDFINKVGWGLNIVFSNGLGYPRTNWLICDGAKDELTFKDYLRRHQLATQVWYNATPGVTACDMERNARIRRGLEKTDMSDAELAQWIRLFG
jgi:hypothetical protein